MTLARTPFKPRTAPMVRSGFLTRTPFVRNREAKSPRPALRSRQRTPTNSEKLLWSRMVETVGCIACQLDGRFNPEVSIHHIDGRTKSGCHELVLPLCAGHHQDGAGEDKSLVAVHPDKARFERLYGPQMSLLSLAQDQLRQVDGGGR